MNNVYIYFGPKFGFEELLNQKSVTDSEITNFSTLVRKSDEASREYKHIINISEEEIPEKEPIKAEYLVVYSDEYASVREHVILNFEGFISDFEISNIFLHNPPQLILNKIQKSFPDNETTFFEYPSITESTLRKINNEYCQTIIGQDKAKLELLTSLVPLTRDKFNKPVVLLFYGPSGVGKTETAKFLSKCLEGDLLRKQLSMFQNNDFMTYLFGGHHYEKSFAKDLIERESNVILLDEFDKANPVFHSAYYQLFDEGTFEDKNYNIEIKKSVIICTSNYNSLQDIRQNLGDPIFSRFDSCIKFESLKKESIQKIVSLNIIREWELLDEIDKSLITIEEIESLFQKVIDKIDNARRIKSLVREIMSHKVLERILS
jgi:ATP-dependent Clp protease ATP-binding subunit ClpA